MNKKLTLRDKAILLVLLLTAFIYVGYNYLYLPVTRDIEGLQGEISELDGKDFTHLDEKLETLVSENTEGLKVIGEIKETEMDNSFDSQMFLIYLSDICHENGVNLVKFNELDQSEQEGVWKQLYDFELCGNIGSINKVVEGIDQLKVKYSISSMSFRQNNDFSFLERIFDGISKLEWYTDPIPEPKEQEEIEVPEENVELPEPQVSIVPPAAVPEITPIPEAETLPKPEEDTSETDLSLELSSFNLNPSFMYVNEYEHGDVYRLCISIQFIMYSDPQTGGAIKSEIL